MHNSKILTFVFLVSSSFIVAQQPATSAETVKQALVQKQKITETSLVKNVFFENIGPSVMSGRVVDVDVNPDMPSEFYVGYASGGVWHTTNNGTTFTPILDNSATQNVGDIAVDWKNRTIWVGTGENNSSRSSYAGIGILKSKDNGKTWEQVGLSDSHHIGRILINPNNPEEVVIGVTGHLYSPNEERGIYKTTNGGETWNKTLFIDNMSGVIDVQHAPNNFEVMLASSWTRERKAWNFTGNGNNSALYKSTDGGATWVKVSTINSGFPTGEGVGRIGIAIFDENTMYVLHDSQFRRKEEDKTSTNSATTGLTKEDFKTMSVDAFMTIEDKSLNEYLKTNGFQEKYRAPNVKLLISSGSVKPIDLASYLEDANAVEFDTPVIGAEVYLSTDGGKSWNKTHTDYIDGLYSSYGYYFGEIRVDPQDKNGIYIMGVPFLKSKDAGKTFTSISRENVHSDHQALWVNPKMQGHLLNGNDGGLNMSYDDGENWTKLNSPSVGQFYAINVDNEKPYNVYGGLQDNGVWVGANNARKDKAWHQSGQYPWGSIMGGDGMQIQIDSRDANTVYTGYQFGNYFRINRETGAQKYIQPKHTLGETPYRFNWQTPILLSSHNQDILYLGGNKLMRSMNKGDDFEAISDDLTNGGKKGNVAYGTLTTISESPFQFGLIYTGSDDGVVSVTKNAGGSWTNISDSFPKDLWASRVVASKYKKERVYVTLNGYRWDNFKVYAYMSNDYGQTWKDIGVTIPASPVNIILEDSENKNILYLGTDNGAYVSFDTGNSWELFSNGLPNVAIHDMVIQPEAKHILLGTHGRSVYRTNIEILQKSDVKTSNEITLMDIESVRHSGRWGTSWSPWSEVFEPKVTVKYFSITAGQKTMKILSEKGAELNKKSIEVDKGFNFTDYNLELTEKGKKALLKENPELTFKETTNKKDYLPKGKYTIDIEGFETKFEIK